MANFNIVQNRGHTHEHEIDNPYATKYVANPGIGFIKLNDAESSATIFC